MIKNRDLPAYPVDADARRLIDEAVRKDYVGLSGAIGMTKYEHVILEFAKAVVSAGGRPDPDGVVTTAICLAHQYFKRLDK